MSNYPPPPPSGPGDPSVIPPGMYRASDGNVYPQPPPQKKKGGAGKVLLIIAAALFGLCFLGIIVAAIGAGSGDDDKVATSDTTTTVVPSGGTVPGSVAPTPAPTVPAQVTVPGKPSGGANPAEADVKITKCGLSEFGNLYTATLAITNNSSKPSNYIINITFESPDGKQRYAEGYAASNNVPNGQTSNTEAGALTQAPAGQQFVCKVAKVTRYAS